MCVCVCAGHGVTKTPLIIYRLQICLWRATSVFSRRRGTVLLQEITMLMLLLQYKYKKKIKCLLARTPPHSLLAACSRLTSPVFHRYHTCTPPSALRPHHSIHSAQSGFVCTLSRPFVHHKQIPPPFLQTPPSLPCPPSCLSGATAV